MKRIGCGLSLGLWALALPSFAAADGRPSYSPLPLFAPDLLQEVFYGEVFDLANDARWVCGVEEPRDCSCVVFTGPDYGLTISHWSEDGSLVIWHQVQLYDRHRNSHFSIEKVVFDRQGLVFELEGFEYRGLRKREVLRLSEARMERTSFEATGVSWVRGVWPEVIASREETPGCAPLVAVVDARTEATAASATYEGQTWGVKDLRLMGGRLKAGSTRLSGPGEAPGQGRSGWLPGTLMASEAFMDLETGIFLAPPRLAVSAHISMPASFGMGLSHFSARDSDEGREFQRLRIDLRYIADRGGLVLSGLGTSRLGGGPVHLSADLEMPGYGALWSVQRLERSASFRSWQLSRAGLALSSGSHFLQIQGGHLVVVDPLSSEQEQALSASTLHFGSRYELALGSELHVAARGRVVRDAHGEDGGRASARLMVQRPFGSGERAYVLPWVSGALAYGVFSLERGIAVGTTGQILAGGETGVALEGRFSGVRHRLRPRLIGIGELASFGARDESIPGAEAVAAMHEQQVEGLRLMGAMVDQGLVLNEGWRIDLPLVAVALEDSQSPRGLDIAGAWRLGGPGAWQAYGAMICREGCSRQVLQGEFQWPIGDHITVGHHLSRDRDSRASAVLGLLTGASPALLGGSVGQQLYGTDIGWFYRHSLSVYTDPVRFELAVPGTLGVGTLPGIEARVRLGPPRLGWYLGLDGSVEQSSGRWLAMIGVGL